MTYKAQWLLRIGTAFSFAYAAIASFINPTAWIGFFPIFVQQLVPAVVLTSAWSIIELVLAVLLLALPNPKIPAWIATILLIGVTATNLGAFDIVFRDVSLALAAAALALMHHKPVSKDALATK